MFREPSSEEKCGEEESDETTGLNATAIHGMFLQLVRRQSAVSPSYSNEKS